MTTSAIVGFLLGIAMVAGCGQKDDRSGKTAVASTVADTMATRPQLGNPLATSAAAQAVQRAGRANKHLYVFFFSKNDEPTRLARNSFEQAMRRIGSSVEWVAVDVTSAGEAEFVDKCSVRSTPMPMALAFAPNGAVTGGFRTEDLGNEERLRSAILSRGLQECLKALQERKMVFICVQGEKTQFNKEAMRGVEEFKADARYSAYTAVVKIDPSDVAERNFLSQLKIDAQAKEAVTALLLPPNYMLGVTNGPTSKASFINQISSATSRSCGPKGCGPAGCGPVKK